MNEHDHIRDAVNQGLDPVMDQTPEHPDWDSLQFNKPRTSPGARAWWVGAVAAAAIVVVGTAILLPSGVVGADEDEAGTPGGASVADTEPVVDSHSIAGVWVLESYELHGETIFVAPGVNTVRIPWLEFHETFSGSRETFASADGEGTAGTFTGDTGCNRINHGYEFSAGFLVLEEVIVEAGGCAYEVEDAMISVLDSEPGLETFRSGDTMELHGQLYGQWGGTGSPLTFRREGAARAPLSHSAGKGRHRRRKPRTNRRPSNEPPRYSTSTVSKSWS